MLVSSGAGGALSGTGSGGGGRYWTVSDCSAAQNPLTRCQPPSTSCQNPGTQYRFGGSSRQKPLTHRNPCESSSQAQ